MGKILVSGSLCLLFAFSGLSCTRHRTEPHELVLGITSQPTTLDPRYATDAYGQRIVQLMFSSLVRVGPDLKVQPGVARTWTYKNLTYTFELTPNLIFHNGRAVEPEDLLFSYQQFAAPNSMFASSFNDVESFDAKKNGDHLQVTIKLKKFVANFLGGDLAALKIIPKAEIEGFPKVLIGSGPFRFVNKSDNEIVLARFEQHPLSVPKMPKVVFKVVRDDFTRYQKLLRGELDMELNEISIDKVPTFEKMTDRFTVLRHPSASCGYLLLNLQDPILANLEVRKALSQSINRPEIIRYKLEGLGREATSILPTLHPYYNHDLANPPYDVAAAKAIIEKLGLKGKKLLLKSSNDPSVIDRVRVLAYQLSQSGLDVELQSFEWGKFYDDIKRGNFAIANMKWVGLSDADIYRAAFDSHEKPPGGRNRGHYSNPKVDAIVEKAVNVEDEETRKKLYQEAQKLVFEDYPILPLWYEVQVVIMKKGITGFTPSITGDYDTLVTVSKTDPGLTAGSPLSQSESNASTFDSRN